MACASSVGTCSANHTRAFYVLCRVYHQSSTSVQSAVLAISAHILIRVFSQELSIGKVSHQADTTSSKMPSPVLPPTPAASTEIAAQERPWTSSSSESNLALPPPALQSAVNHGHLSSKSVISTKATCSFDSTTTHPPNRAVSGGSKKSRVAPEDEQPFSLPSPPTRSRKIIQMKPPRPQPETQSPNKRRKITTSASEPQSTQKSSSNHVTTTSKPTKKAIRKTAHSLIERRRRSKMNDAFSTLKDMIPACRTRDERDPSGKEMHKLDVLNAGIEYLAYLEKCLEKMNERQWEGRSIGMSVVMKHEKEEVRTEAAKEDMTFTSMERQPEELMGQQYGHQQDTRDAREQKAGGMPVSASSCHCRCHSQSGGNASEDAGRTNLPPSPPLLQSPSLIPRPQDHLSPQVAYIKDSFGARDTDRDRERERERDHEETTNTAAALLMLTSTDRRGNYSSSNSNSNSNVAPPQSPATNPFTPTTSYPQTQPDPRPLPIKTGLSVRDLLLK
jgi:Helix-loop-helix DNA-binding domain